MPSAITEQRQRFHSWAVRQRNKNGLPYFISQRDDGEYYDDSTNHAWAAWQARCPDGWRVVPKEPTPAQMVAGLKIRVEEDGTGSVYRAMLSAAPQPGEES